VQVESATASEFFAKQTEYLRTRLSANIDETASLERYSIALTGAMWAWMATHRPLPSGLIPWLPVLLTILLGVRAMVVYGRIRSIRQYLTRAEEAAGVPKEVRWFVTEELAGSRWRPATAVAWWSGLTVVNVAFGLAATRPGW
jgi:hypothetical protein